MEKPVSLSVKDWIVRKMAVKMMLPEKTLDAVISHQFQLANDALSHANSVEVSGFGKFYFNYKKAVKRMQMLLRQREFLLKHLSSPDVSDRKKLLAVKKIESLTRNIEILKPKLENESFEFFTDLRGVEEQINSFFRHSGLGETNIQREIGDMQGLSMELKEQEGL